MHDAEKDLPTLLNHANRVQLLAESTVEKGIKYSETDHFGFMLISFLMKQLEHIRSVSILVQAGQHNDATAIARRLMYPLVVRICSR